ncbi:fibronectin type III and SPRY domain-containing protein 2 [Callorhinchus milii]|uniref:fibronectin type III and SPRY domain-containing protein 2 n=1 Tax=Callorhinchus milii TaxID=7868 RepID=UPI001C3F7124|nr:fibronectin type III and SPRY domain-containing protein 2 [Callorhinchus milii]
MENTEEVDQPTQQGGISKEIEGPNQLLPSEVALTPENTSQDLSAEEMVSEGFQFYHMDLYDEPIEGLGIFSHNLATDKQSDSREKAEAISPWVQGAEENWEQDKERKSPPIKEYNIYDEDERCEPLQEDFTSGGNRLELPKTLGGFDPFQQIVDYSESMSQFSDRVFSPLSDRSLGGFEEFESLSFAAKEVDDEAETQNDLGLPDTTELEDQNVSEDITPDIYCQACNVPIPAFEKLFGSHKNHEVTTLASAAEETKSECQGNLRKLEQQIIQMETFANQMEEIFITVEENFGKQEHYVELQYDDLMQFLVQRYEDRIQSLEEQKEQKLEKLYAELVHSGQRIDSYKELMESTEEVCRSAGNEAFLKVGGATLDRLEEFLQEDVSLELPTTAEFEKFPTDTSEVQQLIDSINSMPAPSPPSMSPQTPDTAMTTAVRVCWSLSADDTVDYYQLYYIQLPQAGAQQESKGPTDLDTSLKVKETFCTVSDLQPGTLYEFWVTATNGSGTSGASDRAVYTTVAVPPAIKSRECTWCQDAASIQWEPAAGSSVQSYTVEFCQVCCGCDWTESITESMVGITSCKAVIQLEPLQSYLIYVRAVNKGGSSHRSQPITIKAAGTCLYLNESTAHPSLSILDDGLTIVYNEEEEAILTEVLKYEDRFTRCLAVLGELTPVRGKHYWEVEVEETTEYQIGVASPDTPRDGYLGTNITSWCMRHIFTPSRRKFVFLHSGVAADLRITVPPRRIGVLLDYKAGKLSFFNTDIAQHLFTFSDPFRNFVMPCFALEKPGALKIHHCMPLPDYANFA